LLTNYRGIRLNFFLDIEEHRLSLRNGRYGLRLLSSKWSKLSVPESRGYEVTLLGKDR